MDLNDCKSSLRSELKKALLVHCEYRSWHYGLNLSESSNPSSLPAYLKLTNEQYEDVLSISGLERKKKYGNTMRFEINRDRWEHFLIIIGMDPQDKSGNHYFDQLKAKEVEDKNRLWLRLGNVSRREEIRNAADVLNERKK